MWFVTTGTPDAGGAPRVNHSHEPASTHASEVITAVAAIVCIRSRQPYTGTHATNDNWVLVETICASRAASQLVSRTQPWLSARPIVSGLGVP